MVEGEWRIFEALFSVLLPPSCAPLRGRLHGVTNVAGSSSRFLFGGTGMGILGVLGDLGELGGGGFAAWDTGCDYVRDYVGTVVGAYFLAFLIGCFWCKSRG